MTESLSIARRIKRFARQRLEALGYRVLPVPERGKEVFPDYIDPLFQRLYRKHYRATMVPWQGLYTAFKAARYVTDHRVPGDIVECGVWRGGCAAIMADALAEYGDTDRTIYLYDTFTGMAEPTELDSKGRGTASAKEKFQNRQRDGYVDWCYGPIDAVRETIAITAYPADRFQLVKGKVEDTIPANIPEQIALLRLDTDFYESTRHELQHLYPLLVPGGVFIADDFGAWEGARKAINEYFANGVKQPFLQLDSHYGAVSGIKP